VLCREWPPCSPTHGRSGQLPRRAVLGRCNAPCPAAQGWLLTVFAVPSHSPDAGGTPRVCCAAHTARPARSRLCTILPSPHLRPGACCTRGPPAPARPRHEGRALRVVLTGSLGVRACVCRGLASFSMCGDLPCPSSHPPHTHLPVGGAHHSWPRRGGVKGGHSGRWERGVWVPMRVSVAVCGVLCCSAQ